MNVVSGKFMMAHRAAFHPVEDDLFDLNFGIHMTLTVRRRVPVGHARGTKHEVRKALARSFLVEIVEIERVDEVAEHAKPIVF